MFSKYFQKGSSSSQVVFEQLLCKNMTFYLSKCLNKQSITIDDKHVVFQKCGELIIVVCGHDDFDENPCKYNIV